MPRVRWETNAREVTVGVLIRLAKSEREKNFGEHKLVHLKISKIIT